MNPSSLAELKAILGRHAGPRSAPSAQVPNVLLGFETGPTPACQLIIEPVFAIVAQGTKRVEAGGRSYNYGVGQALVVSVALPADSFVIKASEAEPYLGCGLILRPEPIANLLLEVAMQPRPDAPHPQAISVTDLSNDVSDTLLRLLQLLDRPADIPILSAALERELLWRLLNGPQGHVVRQIGLADSRLAQISRAIRWLRAHFAESIRIEALADIAGMSETSFHRHFRAVTTMTPIQFQKQLRLQAARARLVALDEDVMDVGYKVGYDNPSQFSREYRRMFGNPPRRDADALRSAGGLGHSGAV